MAAIARSEARSQEPTPSLHTDAVAQFPELPLLPSHYTSMDLDPEVEQPRHEAEFTWDANHSRGKKI